MERKLNLVHVIAIASGAMISSGIFILPGLAHARAGPAVIFSYALAGLFALSGTLSMAEIATAMPRAGGDYFSITRGMGPAVGTVAGLFSWFSLALKSSFALLGMAAFSRLVLSWDIRLIGVILTLFFVLLNILGVKEAARLQVALVVGLLFPMVLYVIMGFPEVRVSNFEDFTPHGAASVFSTAGFVFVAYGGLLKIASLAGEMKNPGKVIPRGMLISLLLVTVLYTLMVFVTSGVLPREQLDGSLRPISDGAAVFMGKAAPLLALAAILAFVSTANAGLMAASRYIFATSHDCLLPPVFAKVNRRFSTPHVAILVTGLFIILSLFLQLEVLVKAASTVLLITYILVSLSIIVLRESRLHNYRPLFRCPFYPWVQLAGIAGYGFLLLEMGKKSFFITMAMIVMGLLFYIFYGRFRAKKESALMHLVDRITARELGRKGLESELKEIVRERDLVVQDRFDHVIEESLVLDLEGPLGLEEFLEAAAAVWSERLPLTPEKLKAAFLERERQSTTVLSPGLAIPHIILSGTGIFDILIARCRQGVRFNAESEPVRTIFMLAGTLDQRNFYLRALAAIAQIFQGLHFEKRWRDARNPQALRDLVLLSRRRRDS